MLHYDTDIIVGAGYGQRPIVCLYTQVVGSKGCRTRMMRSGKHSVLGLSIGSTGDIQVSNIPAQNLPVICLMSYLIEPNGGGLFPEALTADVQAVLSDDTTLISADSTYGKQPNEGLEYP